MTSDGDLIPVTRGDLLELWLLAHDGLQGHMVGSVNNLLPIAPWLEGLEELLDRIGEKLDNPCRECHLSGGAHKFGCSEILGGLE